MLNKIDLTGHAPARLEVDGLAHVRLSALTGAGLELLVEHIKTLAGFDAAASGTYSARRRHVAALERAADHVANAAAELERGMELAA
ncbi:MAG: tRNA uridine-5-carboxymethylaminomethyl(34) synthesis GTPase MnmE, partial [Gammaproteobacteria bacterium]|nr:tRNA uridine-5-carboxymethylaminomethyl(34) synthesis GTPase MnmE [Gammaproteobacteria bacterium]